MISFLMKSSLLKHGPRHRITLPCEILEDIIHPIVEFEIDF